MFFSNKESITHTQAQNVGPTPPSKPSSWNPPKSTIPEVETFLSLVQNEIFQNTVPNKTKDNLSRNERLELQNWRKNHLFNKDSNLVMRLQDKGNRFIIVDKDTDTQKAEEQIARSSFDKIDHDPTSSHVEIVTTWAQKWFSKGQISKEWKDFIINESAQPGKNSTLYKTHKPGIPV